jgi:hypothetical protein
MQYMNIMANYTHKIAKNTFEKYVSCKGIHLSIPFIYNLKLLKLCLKLD